MTLFGSDVSSYQAGLDIAHLPDAFVLMKCTEDISYVDADYPVWLAAAKSAGKLPIAYHFIGPSDPAKQAAHLAAHILDHSVPVMVDFEDEGAFHPTLAELLALDDAINAAGMHVALNYFPRWKWGNLGSPSLTGLTQRGIGLVSSAYPNLTVAPAGQVYAADGGDSGSGWAAYGGVKPLLWQFSDRVTDGGQQVDMNAFRGGIGQLAAYLSATTPTSAGGSTVPNIPASIATKWPDIAGDFPPNGTWDDATATIWSDAGARAAALYAREARDAVNALAAKVSGQPVDVNALAAQLGPLLHPTTDVNALATALEQHNVVQDAAAFAAALAPHIKVVSQ